MKLKNNWKDKSLDNLEGTNTTPIDKDETSYLLFMCNQLRKKQLKYFEIEDIRILIGQNIGLNYLIPLAIDSLENNILAEGDYYEGDLLKSVLTSDQDYWKTEVDYWNQICTLFNDRIHLIKKEADEFETGRQILKAFKKFEKIN